MTPPDVVTYAGSTAREGFDDLTPGPELARAAEDAVGLVILDPLSFPWEAFAEPPRCPVIVDLSLCDDADTTALLPVLGLLTPSDSLIGEGSRVTELSATLGVPALSGQPASIDRHIERARASKVIDMEERAITGRLSQDAEITAVVVTGEELRSARSGFPKLVAAIRRRDPDLRDAELDEVWGVHQRPGEPVDRAVLAFRVSSSTTNSR